MGIVDVVWAWWVSVGYCGRGTVGVVGECWVQPCYVWGDPFVPPPQAFPMSARVA